MKWGLAALTVAITAVAFAAPAGAAKPPPGTVIDTGPAAVTAATTAMFTFHATKATATFSCRMDGASFTACTSPTTVTGVTPGAHTFSVYATGNSGSDPTPATLTWSVDQTNPTEPTGLSATPAGPTSMALRWTAGTDNASIAGNDIARDGTVVATIGAVTSWTDTSVAAASTHTYTVVSIDAAGNKSPPSQPATATTPATPTPPDTIVDTAPPALTNASSATVTFHATTPGATFTCILDSGKANSCTSPRTYTGLSSGSHTFTVRATANSLTDPTPAQASWTVDTIAPSVPTGLATTTADSAVTLTWTASTDVNGVAGYDVYRGGTLLQSVAATTTYTDSTVTPGRLYSYAVRAKDAAGNTSALSPAVTATASAAYDPHLTRAPYLTDLVNLNVAINFATDRSDTTGSAQYGAVNPDGSCIPTTSVAAIRSSVLVGTVSEYQWKVPLTLPATGSYCYRVYLGPIDLLAGNASPVFTTQAQPGSTESYSFDVLGDWGMVDATGQNPGQAALMTQIAASGARFAVTVGDNGYPNGSQINYGDLQQSGAGTSAIFGAQMWPVPGQSIPIFTAVGNHGLAGTAHADITNWPQDVTVATSGGRYQNDVYCCVNGSVSSNYGSEWYAFTAGNTRFYVLDSAWGDTNGGTASPYANDALAHFAPGTPEYQWLVNDLQTHPTQLKFAFSHYPLYVDNPSEFSDSFLQGASNLEGLLGQHGVQIVFNGHAHLYERNAASAAGMPITYVTGGGGATLEPIGPCSAFDSYGIGWSPSRQAGSACGRASTPTSDSQVYHFLKVTVSGTSVTVSPTDSTGRVFDRQTYTFKVPTDTYLDAQPPAGRTSSTATFAFHGSGTPATFVCSLDGAIATTCTSPTTYTNLAEGRHVFTVAARVGKSMDPTPATAQWTVDTTAPTSPTSVTTNTTSPFSVDVSWTGATDNTGVTAYHV
ncbi:MAG: metallophosphoesterase, partial [Jatrophihabitantaceae bacterium]